MSEIYWSFDIYLTLPVESLGSISLYKLYGTHYSWFAKVAHFQNQFSPSNKPLLTKIRRCSQKQPFLAAILNSISRDGMPYKDRKAALKIGKIAMSALAEKMAV